MLFKNFMSKNIPAVKFNVRGAGNSNGSRSWSAVAERKDIEFICDWLSKQTKIESIILIGYSYGSVLTSSVASLPIVKAYAAISYPFGVLPFLFLRHLKDPAKIDKPKLFITGDSDNFTGMSKWEKELNEFPAPLEKVIVEEVDHFWFGTEQKVFDKIFEWISKL